MMVWRSKLILTMIDTYRVTLFLTEADAVWSTDAAAAIQVPLYKKRTALHKVDF